MKQPKTRFRSLERIGIHKVALTFLEKYGWIEREQPISDFGIDMHIEIVENGEPTGQLIGLQVKSGQSYLQRKKEKGFLFDRGKKRHLEYWISQSIPVLIVLYDEMKDVAYWEEVKISRVAETPKGWTMLIPFENKLATSKEAIERILFNTNHFSVVEEKDFSYVLARRISVKIIVENTLSSSRIVLRRMIPFFTEKYKKTTYFRNEQVRRQFADQEVDIICLFFYNSTQQFKRGFPFCRTSWKSKRISETDNFSIGIPNEQIGNINVIWNPMAEAFDDHISEKELSKGEYLKIVDKLIPQIQVVLSLIQQSFISSIEKQNLFFVKEVILNLKEGINGIYENELNQSYSPIECQELDDVLSGLTSYIHNFLIVTEAGNRDDDNLKFMYKDYIHQSNNHLEKFTAERNKL